MAPGRSRRRGRLWGERQGVDEVNGTTERDTKDATDRDQRFDGTTPPPKSEAELNWSGERGNPCDLRGGEPQSLCRRRQNWPARRAAAGACRATLPRWPTTRGGGCCRERKWTSMDSARSAGGLARDCESGHRNGAIPGRRSGEHPERQPANRSQNRTATRPRTHAISGTNGVDAGLDTAAFGGRRAFAGGRRRTSGTW